MGDVTMRDFLETHELLNTEALQALHQPSSFFLPKQSLI
jgi:hypothetical protein